MDRFIEKIDEDRKNEIIALKSNMDRFIDQTKSMNSKKGTVFKIQYG